MNEVKRREGEMGREEDNRKEEKSREGRKGRREEEKEEYNIRYIRYNIIV